MDLGECELVGVTVWGGGVLVEVGVDEPEGEVVGAAIPTCARARRLAGGGRDGGDAAEEGPDYERG